jgi:archaellum component FlaC
MMDYKFYPTTHTTFIYYKVIITNMSASEDELSGYIDREESVNESSGNDDAGDESNVSGFNSQDGEGERLPEETYRSNDTPTGIEEDRILREQEPATTLQVEEEEEEEEEESEEEEEQEKKKQKSQSPAQDKLTSKIENELKKQIDRTRSLQDSVKGIQKQLIRIDKTLYSVKKEHEVIRKKHAQFNLLEKRVDSIDKSIRTWKSKPAASKRKTKPKLVKKKRQAPRSTSKRR